MKCPVLKMGREEARQAIDRLIKGDPVPQVFKACTFCFNCNQYCPVEGLRPHELILQRAVENRGKVPAILKYLMNGQPWPNFFQDIYGALTPEEHDILDRWSQPPVPSKEMLFVGCVGKISCRDIDNSVVMKDLPKYGPRNICCGAVAYRIGNWKLYADTIKQTISSLQALDIERMVCYCSSCYNFFENILPNVYGKTLPFKVTSLCQWMWEKIDRGELHLKCPLGFEATVHESCYVSELNGFAGTLRDIYRSAGIKVVELDHHGKNNLSCGAASVVRGMNLVNTMLKEQQKKYKEVSKTGVKNIALNCPGCFITMGFTAPVFGKKLRYMPDELLRAYGDDVKTPLQKRMLLIAKTLVFKGSANLLKRISPHAENDFQAN